MECGEGQGRGARNGLIKEQSVGSGEGQGRDVKNALMKIKGSRAFTARKVLSLHLT